jgi:methoxymalonate biosynthesis acyl carrier protein
MITEQTSNHMDLDDAMKQLRRFIRERFTIPENDVKFHDDVHLFDHGYVDSFGAVALIAFVEQNFAIKMTQNDLIAFPMNTIREISDFALKRKQGQL